MKNQKVNISDIAKKTGLSTTTVSRVLNGKAEQYRIGKKSQKKIEEVAKKLNYVPNHQAANLRSGKSGTIALIIPSLKNPYFASIASKINAEIRKYGYITIIGDSDENADIEEMQLQQFISRNIEGLIIAPCGKNYEQIEKIFNRGLPIVCIDRYFENLDIPYVATDNFDGAYNATKHLVDNGHTNITCIQGVQNSTPNRMRVKGFTDALNNFNITNYNIVGDDFTVQNGYLETKLLLQQNIRPTAIFALSNTIAMGAIRAMKEENVKIPDDISLITFDDHPFLDYLATPLSCIAQPVKDISKMAVKFLFARINKEESQIDQVLLKPSFKFKESIRRIN